MRQTGIHIANFILFLFLYILLIIFMGINPNEDMSYDWVTITSWLGIFVVIHIFITYYNFSKSLFTLYTIFILLSYMFFFGQCFLWAIGIHPEKEISHSIYEGIRITNVEMIRAQLFFLACISGFHLAFILREKNNRKYE